MARAAAGRFGSMLVLFMLLVATGGDLGRGVLT